MKDHRSYAKFVVTTHREIDMRENKAVNVAIAKSLNNFQKAVLRAALAA